WGRPDMALFIFTKAIFEGKPIQLFNNGNMERAFTYVDDIVESLARVIDRVPQGNLDWSGDAPDPATSLGPYGIYNTGNSSPVQRKRSVGVGEDTVGRKAIKEYLPMQPGDVPATFADVDALVRDVDFKPATPIEVGIERFVKWYREFYGV